MRPYPLMATRMVMLGSFRSALLQYAFHGFHYIVHSESEVFEQLRARRRFTVPVDTDHRAFEADVLAPVVADTGFDGDLGQRRNQHYVLVHRRLAVENRRAGHRHDPNRNALPGKLLLRAEG